MKTCRKSLGFLIGLSILLVSCSSPEEQIRDEFDTDLFSMPTSTLLYEYADTYSSATGDCAGVVVDKWYGSEMDYQEIVERYEKKFTDDEEWTLWSEDVARIWRKQTSNALFSMSIHVLENMDRSNRVQLYQLPDSFLQEAAEYPTVYAVSLRYMSKYAANKCFKR